MAKPKKAPSINIRVFLKLLSLFKGHFKALITGVILLLATTLFTLLPPFLIKQTIDNITPLAESNGLFFIFLLLTGATFIKGVLYYLQRLLMESTGQQIIHELRTKTLNHLNRLNFSFFDSTEIGDLVSRSTSDIDLLANFYGFGLVTIINNIATLVGILAILVYWRPILSLAFLALIPFIIHAMYKYAGEVRPLMGQIRKRFGKLTTSVQQSFSGIETIKFIGTEEFEAKTFNSKATNLLNKNIEASKVASLWLPYVHFLIALGTAFTLLWGGWLTINNNITTGMLVGFLTYMGMLLRPIRQTGMLIGMTMNSVAASERVFEILDKEEESLDKGIELNNLYGKISFKNVSFAYDANNYVLNNLNLELPAKQTIALVGPSGAGKSTIINLIPRFYRPQEGCIFIDEHNIEELNIRKLRQNIGYLRQYPFIFDGSILDNLTFGKPDATMHEVITATKKTCLHSFITSLPKGYHTEIGERGVRLSGGQRQRLAMARVLITSPSILILDEPTSNLDRETEASINTALAEVVKDRTVIVIAHRLWTIKNADSIAFVNDGYVVAIGTHQHLYDTCVQYKKFIENQIIEQRSVVN